MSRIAALRHVSALALVVGIAVPVVLNVATASVAGAAASLSCASGTEYVLDGSTGELYSVSDATGTVGVSAGNFGTTSLDGLGIAANGVSAWSVSADASASGTANVYEDTLSTGVVTTYAVSGLGDGTALAAGAVNPATGVYYFSGEYGIGAGVTSEIYAVNPNLATPFLGEVATVATPDAITGDIAFDSSGELYIGSGAPAQFVAYQAVGAVPTSSVGTPSALSTITIGSVSGMGDYDGLAFDPNGNLYVLNADTPSIEPITVATKTVGSVIDLTGSPGSLVDSANCSYTGTLTATTNILARVSSGDQFTVTVARGATTLGSGTTTGSTTGPQTGAGENVGPDLATTASTYTVSETASGTTSLLDYASSYSCIDTHSTTTSSTPHNIETGSDTFTVGALGTLAVGQSVTIFDTANNANSLTGLITALNSGTSSISVNVSSSSGVNTSVSTWSLYNNVSVASGSATSVTFTYPSYDQSLSGGGQGAGVDCDFAVSPGLTITKIDSPTFVSAAGDVITSMFAVLNTGNVTLSSVGVTDTQLTGTGNAPATPTCQSVSLAPGTCTGNSTTLAPGETGYFTTTYTATQADIDAGADLTDDAIATGTDPNEVAYNSPTSNLARVTVTQSPGLTISKSASPGTVSKPGDVITDTFTVVNTGNITFSAVSINDIQEIPAGVLSTPPTCNYLTGPLGACTSGTSTTIAPGQTAIFTATYTVTQLDLDHGKVVDSATATGIEPNEGIYTTPTPSSATVDVNQIDGLTITKTDSPTFVSAAGDVITSMFAVLNTGNVTLSSVGVTDTQLTGTGNAPATPTCQSVSLAPGTCTGNSTTLAPGETGYFTTTYTATQADIDAGADLTDDAIATGTDPNEVAYNSPTSNLARVTVTQSPGLTISKSASPGTVSKPGDVITDTFTVVNTGNITLSAVSINDIQEIPAGALNSVPACESVSLAPGTCSGTSVGLGPGESATFTATYTVTQLDLDHGKVVDSATATGTPNGGLPFNSLSSSATVNVIQVDGLTITKTDSPTFVSAAGDVITSMFAVLNTGNVTLSSVGVTDTQLTGTGNAPATPTCQSVSLAPGTCTGNSTTLAPGETGYFTTTYTATQADIDAGADLTDDAIATGTDPNEVAYNSPTSNLARVTVTQSPGLTISKSASPGTVSKPGDVITDTFTVVNTGNITFSAVSINDIQEIPAGVLSTPPTCNYLTGPLGACTSGTSTTIAPGQTAIFTATYTVTQLDLDHGKVVDSATATGIEPNEGIYTTPTPSSATVDVNQIDGLTITKTDSPTFVSAAGDVITSMFAVLNTGNVTLSSVGVTDTQLTGTGNAPATPTCQSVSLAPGTCTGNSTTLAPGETGYFTTTYTATQADIDAGADLTDDAIATGTDPNEVAYNSPTSNLARVTVTQSPGLTISKSASPGTVSKPGDVITDTFTVVNTGNITLSAVSINDIQEIPAGALNSVPACESVSLAPGTCSGTSVGLGPGESATFTATYTVTQLDLDHGKVVDSATATGTPNGGLPFNSLSSSATVNVIQVDGLTITKTDSPTFVSAAGDVITSMFAVLNTGNVTLSSVGVTDTQLTGTGNAPATPTCQSVSLAPGTCTGNSTTLAPGETGYFTTTYTATQADIDAGADLTDDAIATGTDPNEVAYNSPTSNLARVTVTQSPGLTISKSASPGTVSKPGDVITDTFTVVNTGNITFSAVSINDIQEIPAGVLSTPPTCNYLTGPLGACTSGTSTTIAPGQTAIFTATYTVTQLDLDHGKVVDSATATGIEPNEGIYTTPTPSSATVDVNQIDGLTITKTDSPTFVSAAGDVITSMFAVLNTGNVTLSSVGVTDTQLTGTGNAPATPTCQSVSLAPGTCTGNSTTLAPGETGYFTTTYTATQADIDAGADLTDDAIATGTDPNEVAYITPIPGFASVSVLGTASMSITKTASPTVVSKAGTVIHYAFTVVNTGTKTIAAVNVEDSLTAPAEELTTGPDCLRLTGPVAECTSSGSTSLAPSQEAIFVATYVVTQADMDAGVLNDSATATGKPPSSPPYTTPIPATLHVRVLQVPALSILTQSSLAFYTRAGEDIPYSFVVTNIGNVTLTHVAVTSSLVGISSISCPTTALSPSRGETCTAYFKTNDVSVKTGYVVNDAIAEGLTRSGHKTLSNPSGVVIPEIQKVVEVTG